MPTLTAQSPADVAAAAAAAACVVETHHRLGAFLRAGQTLAQIDAFVAKTLESLRCKSCFYGYKVRNSPAFPSHACLSVNDCVVHGTAGYLTRPMKHGDVLKIDIGVKHHGWIGDAAWTYCFGEPAPQIKRLMECGKEALRRGVEALRVGRPLRDWAVAVQRCVEDEYGFCCIRHWGGHGYGRELHGPPHLNNHLPAQGESWDDADRLWKAGDLIAAEPMIAVGTGETFQHGSGRTKEWPVFVKDGSMSVHYEHDVLLTHEGPRVLTAGLEDVPDIIRA